MTADPKVFVYAAGGYYYPGKGLEGLTAEMQGYLDRGYTVVKMKIGGAPLAEDCKRIEAVLRMLPAGCQPRGRRQRPLRPGDGRRLRQGAAAYDLFWYEEAGDPLDYELQAKLAEHYAGPMATGENLFSMQDARNLIRYGGMRPDRDWLQFDCALSYGLVEYLRTLEMLKANGWSLAPLHPARRPPDVAEHRRRPGPGRQRVLPGPVPALWRLPGWRAGGERPYHHAGACRASASRARRT